jgi:hypothetical protein
MKKLKDARDKEKERKSMDFTDMKFPPAPKKIIS